MNQNEVLIIKLIHLIRIPPKCAVQQRNVQSSSSPPPSPALPDESQSRDLRSPRILMNVESLSTHFCR